MTILLLGANGQVGRELMRSLSPVGKVVAATRSGNLFDGRRCESFNLDMTPGLTELLDRCRPRIVVNAAAYTAVDLAEQQPDAAYRANAEAPGVIARWCAAHLVPMVHYSTDYVFDGEGHTPYQEDRPPSPLSVYGASKRDGEEAVRAAGGRHLIFRTAWVHAAHGRNFLRTMLRLAAEGDALRVVADQVGSPTSAALVADVTARVLQHPAQHSGTYHLTAAGHASWYGFAEAIFAEAVATRMLREPPVVTPVAGSEFPTVARRPAWSVLDTSKLERDFGERLPDWKDGMRDVLSELRNCTDDR